MADYRVEIEDANAHLLRVTLKLARPAARQALALPAWAPGSYKIRDFARHLSALEARQGGRPCAVEQVDKSRWEVDCAGAAPLVASWLVYAFDRSVRAAFVDAERAFLSGPCLFLRAEGREAEPCRLALGRLPRGWTVASAMPARGARRYEAADYAELIDHPLLLGRLRRDGFEAGGVAHEIAIDGAWPGFDGERLAVDVRRICRAQIAFWHGRGRPPMRRYVFLVRAGEEGPGGIEHRESTALQVARRDLPAGEIGRPPEGYTAVLALFSHEYFHAWNVQRMRPREFVAPDLGRENPSRLLWFYEGFTAYYDEAMLLRAGLVGVPEYLRLLARAANAVLASPGRQVQSLAEASFEAWTKYYQRDENTPNATVSYYDKGALVALLVDLALRARGSSLDAVMRRLWRRAAEGPVGAAEIEAAVQAEGGADVVADLRAWVQGRAELPLAARLQGAGVELRQDPAPLAAQLGLRLAEGAFSGVQVRQVLRGSAAEAAGIAAGDELLAVNGWRVRRLEDARAWLDGERAFDLLLVREQRVLMRRVERPLVAAMPSVTLLLDDQTAQAALALRRAWLGA